jgi:hypothetical protein
MVFILSLKMEGFVKKFVDNDEIMNDTRTFLFVELFSDLNTRELVIGRGALGTYYSPYFQLQEDEEREGDNPVRSESEVGYLFMILKGGGILMLLYLAVLIPAAILGIFDSKNIVVRMCGYYILLYVLLWPLSYIPTFVPKFIVLWMAAGTCMSSRLRNTQFVQENKKSDRIFAKQ